MAKQVYDAYEEYANGEISQEERDEDVADILAEIGVRL